MRSSRSKVKDPVNIDPEKFRAAIRKLRRNDLFLMIDRAVDMLTPEQLAALATGLVDIKSLVSVDLLTDVRRFCEDSRQGTYYEDFDVNSKNYMQQSRGTESWIAECERVFERCVIEASTTDPAILREAMGLLLDLLRRVDECEDDVVFFADEGGAWVVGVDWDRVLPVWFRSLASTAEPAEFAKEAVAAIDDFERNQRDKFLKLAHAEATPAQREALAQMTRS